MAQPPDDVFQKYRDLEERCLSLECELAKSSSTLALERAKAAVASAEADQLRLELEREQRDRRLAADVAAQGITISVEADAKYEAETQELRCRLHQAEHRLRLLEILQPIEGVQSSCGTSSALGVSALNIEERLVTEVSASREEIRHQSELILSERRERQQLLERNEKLEENLEACRFCRDRLARSDIHCLSKETCTLDAETPAADSQQLISEVSKTSDLVSGTPQVDDSQNSIAVSSGVRPASVDPQPLWPKHIRDCAAVPYTNLELTHRGSSELASSEPTKLRPLSELGHHKNLVETNLGSAALPYVKSELAERTGLERTRPRPASELGHHKSSADANLGIERVSHCSAEPCTNTALAQPTSFEQADLEPTRPRSLSELGYHKSSAEANPGRSVSNCSTRASTRLSDRHTPSKDKDKGQAFVDSNEQKSDHRLPALSSNALQDLSTSSEEQRAASAASAASEPLPAASRKSERVKLSLVVETGGAVTPVQSVGKRDSKTAVLPIEKDSVTPAQAVEKRDSKASAVATGKRDSPALALPVEKRDSRAPVLPIETGDSDSDEPMKPMKSISTMIEETMPEMINEPASNLHTIKRQSTLGLILDNETRRRSAEDDELFGRPQPRSSIRRESDHRRDSDLLSESDPLDDPTTPKTPHSKKRSMRTKDGGLSFAESEKSAVKLHRMLEERQSQRMSTIRDPAKVICDFEAQLFAHRAIRDNGPHHDEEALRLVHDFGHNMMMERFQRDRHIFENVWRPFPPIDKPPDLASKAGALPIEPVPPVGVEISSNEAGDQGAIDIFKAGRGSGCVFGSGSFSMDETIGDWMTGQKITPELQTNNTSVDPLTHLFEAEGHRSSRHKHGHHSGTSPPETPQRRSQLSTHRHRRHSEASPPDTPQRSKHVHPSASSPSEKSKRPSHLSTLRHQQQSGNSPPDSPKSPLPLRMSPPNTPPSRSASKRSSRYKEHHTHEDGHGSSRKRQSHEHHRLPKRQSTEKHDSEAHRSSLERARSAEPQHSREKQHGHPKRRSQDRNHDVQRNESPQYGHFMTKQHERLVRSTKLQRQPTIEDHFQHRRSALPFTPVFSD